MYCLILIVLTVTGCTGREEKLARQADRIHRKIVTVDTHCDTPIEIIHSGYDLGIRNNKGCVDFPRMKEGGLDAEFFVMFTSQGQLNDSSYRNARMKAMDGLKTIISNIENHPEEAGIALSGADAIRLKREGKAAAFLGVENGYSLGHDISGIRAFYDLGARYITLSHSKNNDICDSSTDSAGPLHDGLSPFGREVVEEMNRIGMIVDVSHVSDKSFYDILSISKAPVIASHSSCRALCESPRNLTDDMILAMKANRGVVQICFVSEYIKTPLPNPELEARLSDLRKKYGNYDSITEDKRILMHNEYNQIRDKYKKLANIKDVVDHIDHIVQIAGADYVGIGTDFDGGGGVEGCRSASEIKNITIELLRRGYSRSDISKIMGGNILRVLKEAELKKSI